MTQPRNLGAFADNLNTSGQVSLTTGVSGTLPVANGGTGSTSTTFVNLTSNVTGTLPIANGGTNSTATPTAGGVVYGNGSAQAYTAAGTSGQVLTSAGTGTPTWSTPSAGAMTLISTQTASGSSIQWTGLSGYDKYFLMFENLLFSAQDQMYLVLGTGAGPTYATSGYFVSTISNDTKVGTVGTSNNGNTGVSNIILNNANFPQTSGMGNTGNIYFQSFTNSNICAMTFVSIYQCNNTAGSIVTYIRELGQGILTSNTTVKTAIKLSLPSSTFVAGTASLYGISS